MHSSAPWLPPPDPLLYSALAPLLAQCPCGETQGSRGAGAMALAGGSSEFPLIPPRPGFHFKWLFSRSNEGLKLWHMSALVKMEDLLSSCRVQKELQRVKFPVQWTLSAVPGHCLTWDCRHIHQGELEAEISKTQGVGHTKSICFYADWESDSYQIQAQKGTHSPPSSESSFLGLSMPTIGKGPATAPLNTTTHMAPGRGSRSAESHMLLPAEPCSHSNHYFGGHRAALLPLLHYFLSQRNLAAKTSGSDWDKRKGKQWRKKSKAKRKSFSFRLSNLSGVGYLHAHTTWI